MKTRTGQGTSLNNFSNNTFKLEKSNSDSRILNQSISTEYRHPILYLYSPLFTNSNYKIDITGTKACIIISEHIEINQPHISSYFNVNYSTQKKSYDRMFNIGLLLPSDDFYLISHYLIPEKCVMKIVFGKKAEK